jgi:hypothetical protein
MLTQGAISRTKHCGSRPAYYYIYGMPQRSPTTVHVHEALERYVFLGFRGVGGDIIICSAGYYCCWLVLLKSTGTGCR